MRDLRTGFKGILGALAFLPSFAFAQEWPFQMSVSDAQSALRIEAEDDFGTLESLPAELEWITRFNFANPDMVELLRLRIEGLEFYGPYLRDFAELSPDLQSQIVSDISQIEGKNSDQDPSIARLRGNLLVTVPMFNEILSEARANEADEDFDMPAFEDALIEYAQSSSIEITVLESLMEDAPEHAGMLPAAIEIATVNAELAMGQAELAKGKAELAKGKAELIDAEATLQEAKARRMALERIVKLLGE